MRNSRIALVGALAAVAMLLEGSASAGPRTVSETYDVTAVPAGPVYYGDTVACGSSAEGVHKNTRPLKAPFSGWLTIELTGLTGDWDLALTDPKGRAVAWAGSQFFAVGDYERLAYYTARGRDLRIVVCNYAGAPTARVTYQLVEGGTGVAPQKRYREFTAEQTYESPAAGAQGRWALCYVGFGVGCAAVTPPAWARYVRVSVEDAVSPAVAAQLYSYAGETSYGDQDFCTAIDEPVRLEPRVDWVGVVVLNGPCLDGTPAQATRGTVTFTFSSHATPRG